eukprot:1138107-Pelagomonas_calceolata.AAC.2
MLGLGGFPRQWHRNAASPKFALCWNEMIWDFKKLASQFCVGKQRKGCGSRGCTLVQMHVSHFVMQSCSAFYSATPGAARGRHPQLRAPWRPAQLSWVPAVQLGKLVWGHSQMYCDALPGQREPSSPSSLTSITSFSTRGGLPVGATVPLPCQRDSLAKTSLFMWHDVHNLF